MEAWGRGYSRSVIVDYFHFSRDTSHNRLIRYALHLAVTHINSLPKPRIPLLEDLGRYSNLFARIPLDRSLHYLPEVISSLREDALPPTREYYTDALRTSALIVENTGINPNTTGDITALSFAVNMEDMFEQYCQVVLKDNASLLGNNTIVKNQDEGKIPLFGEFSPDTRTAEPDIVITQKQGRTLVTLILEVKYKTSPNRNDINQVVTYAVAYKANIGILLCIAEEEKREGWEYLGVTGDAVHVWIYRVSLDYLNMADSERNLVQSMANMLDGTVKTG